MKENENNLFGKLAEVYDESTKIIKKHTAAISAQEIPILE